MLGFLIDIPFYKHETFSGITQEQYDSIVAGIRKEVNRAIELFEAYWKTSNIALFDMSIEALSKAYSYTKMLVDYITDEKLVMKMSRRATFTYDLAAVMLGGTGCYGDKV